MARVLDRPLTIEDWLAYAGEGDTLYELVNGRLVAMSPPKAWHGDIAAEIAGICRDALRDRFPCRVRSQAGIEIAREPKAWHGDIAAQVARICANALDDRFPCRVRSQAGIEIAREPKAKAYIADLAVTCEPVDENRPLMAEPRLVIEVVSPSTDRVDKLQKLQAYMTLPSVEEIWLVWSTGRLVLQATRGPEGWGTPQAFIGKASLASPVLGIAVTLDAIYRTTPLAQVREPEGDFELP